jgi:hypothetical protein
VHHPEPLEPCRHCAALDNLKHFPAEDIMLCSSCFSAAEQDPEFLAETRDTPCHCCERTFQPFELEEAPAIYAIIHGDVRVCNRCYNDLVASMNEPDDEEIYHHVLFER